MRYDADQRALIQAADRIKREKNRERRQRIKADRTPEKANRGREKDKGFLAYIRRQPCEVRHMGGCSGAVQAAHIRKFLVGDLGLEAYRDAALRPDAGGA